MSHPSSCRHRDLTATSSTAVAVVGQVVGLDLERADSDCVYTSECCKQVGPGSAGESLVRTSSLCLGRVVEIRSTTTAGCRSTTVIKVVLKRTTRGELVGCESAVVSCTLLHTVIAAVASHHSSTDSCSTSHKKTTVDCRHAVVHTVDCCPDCHDRCYHDEVAYWSFYRCLTLDWSHGNYVCRGKIGLTGVSPRK